MTASTPYNLLSYPALLIVSIVQKMISQQQVLCYFNKNTVISSDSSSLRCSNEVPFTGSLWRCILKAIIRFRADRTNALRLSRGLHLFVPYLTGYEA